ncbi:S1 family peptidase [Marinococcus luteus]|uniref:S1 family peptidase n=1 Tax=Marinococcus luteus TaxID=1122204 RepID=UPI002ACC71B2|nr:serine protease [Marinococcus luteus]MDZ5782214.1 serine protease [Marinococcus luteus]
MRRDEEGEERLEGEPDPEDFEPGPPRKPKNKRRGLFRIIAVLMAGMLVFQSAYYLIDTFRLDAWSFLTASYQLSKQEDVQQWQEAVTKIQAIENGETSFGTGFFVEDASVLVTNYHVVEGADSVAVETGEGDLAEAAVEAVDKQADLAVVTLKEPWEGGGVTLADTSASAGSDVIVIGNPLGFSDVANRGDIIDREEDQLVLDAPVFNGSSGSPVLTEAGEVAGVVFASGEHQGKRYGLAAPVEQVHEAIAQAEDS